MSVLCSVASTARAVGARARSLMAAERFSNHYCTDLHEPQNNFTVFLVFNISIHPSKFVFAAIFVLFSKQGWVE